MAGATDMARRTPTVFSAVRRKGTLRSQHESTMPMTSDCRSGERMPCKRARALVRCRKRVEYMYSRSRARSIGWPDWLSLEMPFMRTKALRSSTLFLNCVSSGSALVTTSTKRAVT